MSNIINLLSEETFAEKMDIHNKLLAAIASDSGGVAIRSWADVQALVRAGLAAKFFSIGDQLVCERNGVKLVWDIIGFDHDTPSDARFTHSMTLQTHNLHFKRAFCDVDNPSNEWVNDSDTTSLRHWLNSDNENEFLNGIDSDFLAVVGAVEKITAVNDSEGVTTSTSSDKFFILSKTELYGSQTLGVDEGSKYEYFSNSDFTKKYQVGITGANYYFTRTKAPGTGNTRFSEDKLYGVNSTGGVSALNAKTQYGIAPACCIY